MPKISVIIPCHNARGTISKTLHSIAMQTIAEDVEVVVANDADGYTYSDIISNFPDLNIRYVVNDRNKGCGGARNLGTANAGADFVVFADADDMFVNSLSLELMYHTITSKQADVVRSKFISEIRNDKGIGLRDMLGGVTWMHGCMLRKQYLTDNDLWFDEELRINEDVLFNQLLTDSGAKIVEIPAVTYLWRDNPKSITHESLYNNKATFVTACGKYIWECNKRGLSGDKITLRVLQNLVMIWEYFNVCLDECEDKAEEFMSACRKYWQLAKPIVADVPDEIVTKVYCAIVKTLDFIPSVGFIEFLNKLRAD